VAVNAFERLGIPVSFDVELSFLDTCYEKVQYALHPDRGCSLIEREVRKATSSSITQAYCILKEPLSRARHILELNGFWPISEDPDFLEALLEWDDMHDSAQGRYDQAIREFSKAFDDKNWSEAQRAYWWMARMGHFLKEA
jgi:molecular chaperone HscB